jgi:hypothetical protein
LVNAKLLRALEDAGVEFIDENGGGPGVLLQSGNRRKAQSSWKARGNRSATKGATKAKKPKRNPLSPHLLEQLARLPNELAQLPAFLNSFARIQAMLDGVFVAERGT